jgi:hypothetical protein
VPQPAAVVKDREREDEVPSLRLICNGKIGKMVLILLAKDQFHPCTFGWTDLVLELLCFDSVMSLPSKNV